MTSFAPSQIVRCPECRDLVERQHFATINLSDGLFPSVFKSIARGDVSCPHCMTALHAHELIAIAKLDANWKKGVWAGIPTFVPDL